MMNRQKIFSVDFAFPLFLLVLTTIYLADTVNIRVQASESFWQGPRAMPVIAAALMYLLLVIVLVRQFRGPDPEPREGEILRPALVMLATAVYIFLFVPLGYGLSTLIYVSALFVIFEFRTRQPVAFAIYALVVTAIFYILYAVLFGVRLPELFGVI